MLDKKLILGTIARQLQQMGYGPAEQLQNDLAKLNEIITSCKQFPWNLVAEQLNMDRWRLYHWYFETFQRMLLGGVEKSDQMKIKDLIREAILAN